ncbi:MAG: NAD(+) synthase [Bacteroidetes bacterium]|nr:NAD(+) synthase [Bacteroidota bacterium]
MKKKETINHIVNWLTSYCEKSSMKGFVVGVSGGVDSALTSTLCALTSKPLICLNMPILQQKDQYTLANVHIEWLKKKFSNVSSHEVNLTDTFLKLKETLPREIQDVHAMANTRSRLRMTTLYAFSAHHRMLVAGTGNKVEDFGVGFYTKYGDGGVDLNPIADLMKSEVRSLAQKLGVSLSIVKAAPVDGLWEDNRTDEEQIGATYGELEWAMKQLSSKFQVPSSKLNTRQKRVLEIFQRLHQMNIHKMKPIPVCIIPGKLKKG